MNDDRTGDARRLTRVVILLPLVLLVLHATSYLPFISDDALISLRYADRLLNGHGLTWTDGKPVEGYTNLLWVLACAALGLLGVDLILAARFWGLFAMAATLLAISQAGHARNGPQRPLALFAPSVLALSAPVAFWAIGGLEQPFVAAFLAWGLVWMRPLFMEVTPPLSRTILPGLMLGLLGLTRADGGVFCLAAGLGLLAARRFDTSAWKSLVGMALFPVLFMGGQLVFRLTYYGEWLPNPAYVKVAFTTQRLWSGLAYLAAPLPYLVGLLIPAGYAWFVGRRNPLARRSQRLHLVTALVWSAYLVLVGGDIFPAHRQWIPLLVIAGLLLAEHEREVLQPNVRMRPSARLLAVIAGILLLVGARLDPKVRDGREELWEWDGKIVGEMLREAFGEYRPLLACDPAGCLPYFTKFDSIDMMGLNDYHIARQRPSSFGRGVIGHELGDGRYVLDREPDLVIWSRPLGASNPMFPSAIEMSRDPRFIQNYRFVFLLTPQPESKVLGLWIRVSSPKIGIRQTDGRLVIPGVFAATTLESPAMLDDLKRLGVVARAEAPAWLTGIAIPPGRWRLTSEPRDNVRIRAGPPSLNASRVGVGEVVIDWTAEKDSAIEIELSPATGPSVHVRSLTLAPE